MRIAHRTEQEECTSTVRTSRFRGCKVRPKLIFSATSPTVVCRTTDSLLPLLVANPGPCFLLASESFRIAAGKSFARRRWLVRRASHRRPITHGVLSQWVSHIYNTAISKWMRVWRLVPLLSMIEGRRSLSLGLASRGILCRSGWCETYVSLDAPFRKFLSLRLFWKPRYRGHSITHHILGWLRINTCLSLTRLRTAYHVPSLSCRSPTSGNIQIADAGVRCMEALVQIPQTLPRAIGAL